MELEHWFKNQHILNLNLDTLEGGTKYKSILNSFTGDPKFRKEFSARTRIFSNFLRLKANFVINNDGYICSAFTAKNNISAKYTYIYWNVKTLTPEYISISPTYKSKDGEYRGRFIHYSSFEKGYEMLSELFTKVEESLMQIDINYNIDVFPTHSTDAISKNIEDSRLLIKTFVVALFLDFRSIVKDDVILHTNDSYTKLMQEFKNSSLLWLADIEMTDQVEDALFLFHKSTTARDWPECGQKLIPMYIKDIVNPRDVNLSLWREIIISEMVSDLVINFITPSFSIHNKWTYIAGTNAHTFENESMIDKFGRSEKINKIIKEVRRVRNTFEDSDLGDDYRSNELNAKLYDIIEYAQSYLAMSNYSMIITMESVGFPLSSIGVLDIYRNITAIGEIRKHIFETHDLIAHMLFDYVYAIYCLHTKLNIAHTDLHSANMTFYIWFMDKAISKAEFEKLSTMYVIGETGEDDTFVFSGCGFSGSIIDYSRILIGPKFRDKFRDQSQALIFYRDQTHRVMGTFLRFVPSFVEQYEDKLKAAIMANYDAIFPLLCTVDYISIGRNTAQVFEMLREKKIFNIPDSILTKCKEIETIALEHLLSGLQELVETGKIKTDFLGHKLINKVFSQYKFDGSNTDDRVINDIYNYNNTLEYTSTDYGKYPSWASISEIEQHSGATDIAELLPKLADYIKNIGPNINPSIVSEQARQEKEKMDGKEIQTATSWIDF